MAVYSQTVSSFLKHAAVSAISLAAILAVGTLSAGVVELSLTVDPVRELGLILR